MPENDLNNLDEQLRRKFENFGSHPSDKVWENIASGVAQENLRKRRNWLWFSMTALLVIVSGAITWLLLSDRPDGPMTAVSSQKVIEKQVTEGSETAGISSGKNTPETTKFDKSDENEYVVNSPGTKIKTENIAETIQPERSESATASNLYSAKTNSAKAKPGKKAEVRKPVNNAIASAKELLADKSSVSNTKTFSRSTAARSKSTQVINTKTKPANVSQGTKSGADYTALNEPSAAKPASVLAGTSSEEGVIASTDDKPVTNNESAEQALTEKAASGSPVLKDEVAVTTPDKAVVTQNQVEQTIVINQPVNAAEKADNATPENLAQPKSSENNASETENAEKPAIATNINQPAGGFPIKDEVVSTSMAKSAAAAKAEEDYLEKEGGIWAQDTTGLTVTPPKDSANFPPPPNAIPLRSVELFGSAEYGFRTLSGDAATGYIQNRNKHETAGLGYSGGVNLTFGLTKKLGLKTGLQYTVLREKLNYPAGFPDDLQAAHSSYKYLTIPLHLVYEKRGYSNFTISLMAGTNVNMFMGSRCVVLNNDFIYELRKWGDSNHPFKPIAISGTAGIGLQYRVSKATSIMLRPTVTYFPWSITKDSHQQKPYSFGVQTGLRFGL